MLFFPSDFVPKLVSDDLAVRLIHDRIVTNIYNNEIVVCDVSAKNPNVMFELGLRLAFDKPTIIIKDEGTGYSFDTGVIEHITYPSSLRFSQMVKFQEELGRRINATYKRSVDEPNYSPFLKSFGKTITPAKFSQTEIPEGKYILGQMERLRAEMNVFMMEQRRDYISRREDVYDTNESVLHSPNIPSIIKNYLSKYGSLESLLADESAVKSIRNKMSSNGFEYTVAGIRHLIKIHSRKHDSTGNNMEI